MYAYYATHQFPEDAGPLAHPVRPASYMEINNFYTATVYEKGAEIVRMMHTLVGPEAFRKAMDLYFERHDGEAATVENFVDCMADASGRDFDQFFRWYEQAGTPQIVAETSYDSKAQIYDLSLTQATPDTPGQTNKKPQHIPLGIGLIDTNGADMPLDLEDIGPLERPIVELTKQTQKFRFKNVTQRPVLSLNRGFSAPVKITAGLPSGDRLFMMANDNDPFNRWESGQNVARRLILENNGGIGGIMAALETCENMQQRLRAACVMRSWTPASRPLMLAAPGETDLASNIGENVDPQQVHDARNYLRCETGKALAGTLQEIWHSLAETGPYNPNAVSSARRSLRNAALSIDCSRRC